MAPSIAWAKTLLSALALPWVAGCAEGPVHTLGKKPERDDAAVDASLDATPDAGVDAEPDAGMDAEPDAMPDASTEQPFEFEDVQPVAELNVEGAQDDNPTLTANELEIYFTRDDGGETSSDVWTAVWNLNTGVFDPPEAVGEVNTPDTETSPAISWDGNTLWVGTNAYSDTGDHDIFEFRRGATELFELVDNPNPMLAVLSPESDIPRPLGFGETIMPMGRRVAAYGDEYQTFFTVLDPTTGAFGMPMLVEDLAEVGTNFIDAFLTNDGLMLLFQRASNLWYSKRDTPTASWPPPNEIPGVNTDGKERDPWLSRDEQRLYFARSIDGADESFDIYVATRVPAL